jgi:glycosyltransferase involved in cell wall biosynthesis
VKVLILWSGAVVPAYRQFFLELARHMRVRVLSPKSWTHGSISFRASDQPAPASEPAPSHEPSAEAPDADCDFVPAAYWPKRSSRYWVPSLFLHMWTFRPRYLYVMDEMDRPSLAWHALIAKLAWPPVRVVCYALQNLAEPDYYRWHHRLAMRINQTLVSRGIAASEEADRVMKAHGYRGPTRVIPLWGAENFFHPGEREPSAAFRRGLGIPDDAVTLLFAGSLVEAKGLLLLKEVLPRFPRIRLLTAGHGALEETLGQGLGRQWIHLGGLEGDDLRRFYQAGDYVILPSLTLPHWKEQVGRALIEGILCGCVALGSDSGNIPALTMFPETTFRQGDAESLAGLLATLPLPNAGPIREAQLRNVRERFTASAVALRTWEFLREAA